MTSTSPNKQQTIAQWIVNTRTATSPPISSFTDEEKEDQATPRRPIDRATEIATLYDPASQLSLNRFGKKRRRESNSQAPTDIYPTPETQSLQEQQQQRSRGLKRRFRKMDKGESAETMTTPRASDNNSNSNKRKTFHVEADRDTAMSVSSASSFPPASSSHASSLAFTARSKRSRNSSPTKSALLQTLPNPIKQELFHSTAFKQPGHVDLRRLYLHMARIAAGFETVPLSLRPELLDGDGSDDDDVDINLRLEHVYYDDKDKSMDRTLLGRAPSLETIDDIVAAARACSSRFDIEAGWNSSVHGPILNLAKRRSTSNDMVDVNNMYVLPCLSHERHMARLTHTLLVL